MRAAGEADAEAAEDDDDAEAADDDDDEGEDKTLQRIADSESSNKTSALNERHRQQVRCGYDD